MKLLASLGVASAALVGFLGSRAVTPPIPEHVEVSVHVEGQASFLHYLSGLDRLQLKELLPDAITLDIGDGTIRLELPERLIHQFRGRIGVTHRDEPSPTPSSLP